MDETSPDRVIEQLMNNTTDIIADMAGDHPGRMTDLICRQHALMERLRQSAGYSPALLKGLQALLRSAVDAVNVRMVLKRDCMATIGVKKKVLRAYGTVNAAASFREAAGPDENTAFSKPVTKPIVSI